MTLPYLTFSSPAARHQRSRIFLRFELHDFLIVAAKRLVKTTLPHLILQLSSTGSSQFGSTARDFNSLVFTFCAQIGSCRRRFCSATLFASKILAAQPARPFLAPTSSSPCHAARPKFIAAACILLDNVFSAGPSFGFSRKRSGDLLPILRSVTFALLD